MELPATYPEVNVEVSGAAELPVANLEGHGHLVIAAELLVKTFAAVGRELDVVTKHGREEAAS